MIHDQTKNHQESHERRVCNYVNNSERFIVTHRTFERQYAPLYNARLNVYSASLKNKAKSKWGSSIPIKKLCDINVGEKVIVIGTLFKQMQLRPSILKEISEEHHLIPELNSEQFASDDDSLILEDNIQRIVLKGNVDPHTHVTGIVVAVKGSEQDDGKFVVEDICYASVCDPKPIINEFTCDMYVMIVSGLGIGSVDTLFFFQFLIDYIIGDLGVEKDVQKASSIVRLIIAGNSLSQNGKIKEFSSKSKFLTRKTKATTVEDMKALDNLLSELVASINVDVMPGEFDPANFMMPQQPFQTCMFPKSSKYSTFHSVTNPYDALINDIRFLGTSGQNIKDIISYSKLDDPTEVMERTLVWGHLSPTAPDTLNCYPYVNEDPFVMPDAPHVYFAGNMPKMGVKKYGLPGKEVTIVSIPKFCETHTVALVNLRTLSVEPFVFDV